jgi:D-alanyl-D-alanine carboxypeptidase/D-alanyl-D-alanine-endopeptidase (penicillin-binding protein 4)
VSRRLPTLLAGIAVAGAALAGWPATGAPARADASTAAGSGTPVLSPRRVPALLARTVGEERLTAALDAALGDPALGAARDQSCLVVESGGATLYTRRADAALLPASNLKLLTAAAALSELGPDTTLSTEVRVSGGDLWLVGGGDPLLSTGDYIASMRRPLARWTPLEELAKRVKDAGITVVSGSVRGDETRYDTQRIVPTWKAGYLTDNEIGPMSALTVNDGFSAFTPKKIRAAQPATHAAEVFTTLLRNQGVTVVGVPGEGKAPAGARRVAAVPSLPVRDLVGEMLRESDNLTAELLLKEVAHHAGQQGSTAAGVAVARDELASIGVPVGGVTWVDGSGLDRGNRATCATIDALLHTTRTAGAIADGLPVAGQSGTLEKRFTDSPAAAKVRAKTGSLDGVSALSGFAESRSGRLTFSLLLNGLPRDALGPQTWVRVAEALVAYPDAPPVTELAPH